MKRQLATLAALTLPIFSLATPASAQTPTTLSSQGTGEAIVVPLSETVAGAEAGTSRWILINWTSLGGESREFKVTAQGSEGVHVSYPTYPVDGYSSGYQDDTLSSNEIDYTALRLTIEDDAPEPRFIRVTVSWVSDSGPKTDVMDMRIANDDSGGTTTTQPTTSTTQPTTSTTAAPITTEAPNTTEAPTTTEAAESELVVTGLMLVNSDTGQDIRLLVDGDTIDRSEDGRRLSIRAVVEGSHESVEFFYDGSLQRMENIPPYALASNFYDDPNGYFAFNFRNGKHTIRATPFSQDDGSGEAGTPLLVNFTYQR